MEMNRINFSNVVILMIRNFNFSLLPAATFLLQHIFFYYYL